MRLGLCAAATGLTKTYDGSVRCRYFGEVPGGRRGKRDDDRAVRANFVVDAVRTHQGRGR